jgi:dethiobiotin synthetase
MKMIGGRKSQGFFVAGTDTGVGKTLAAQALVAALVAAGERAAGMKPVASGCHVSAEGLRSADAEALMALANVSASYVDVNPYALVPAIAPQLAARAAGVEIRLASIEHAYARLAALADCVVVEGAGGWLTPIGEQLTMADVARALGLPVIMVVGMRLGCLNHALLTQAAIAQCGLVLAGWIANCIEPTMERLDENVAAITLRIGAAPLAVFPYRTHAPTASFVHQLARTLAIPE